MAEQVEAYVKNKLAGEIKVTRMVTETANDQEFIIGTQNEEKILLPEPETFLVIAGPEGLDTKECPIKVKSDIDVSIACSRTESKWAVKLIPNTLPSDTPTTVNIIIGEDEI